LRDKVYCINRNKKILLKTGDAMNSTGPYLVEKVGDEIFNPPVEIINLSYTEISEGDIIYAYEKTEVFNPNER
jgi:hypothetical protein